MASAGPISYRRTQPANPYWLPELRGLTGKDEAVIEFLKSQPWSMNFTRHRQLSRTLGHRFEAEGRSYLTIAVAAPAVSTVQSI